MSKTTIELLFEWIDKTTDMIQQHKDEPYLDCLAITLESLLEQDFLDETNSLLTTTVQEKLKKIDLSSYSSDEIRKAAQLAILKGMKGSTQQQHVMTPDTIALLVGYLAGKVMRSSDKVRVFDPASGTGNLVATVIRHLGKETIGYGSEIDQTLIKLSVLTANLQHLSIDFFHQDSLRPFLLDPVDVVVSDLPVGYYPDDVNANQFELRAEEGHSYSHHLFIEQGINYVQENGYLIFIIPEFLFESDQADKLRTFLHEHAHIVGVLHLPESTFKSKNNAKSILILQKRGQDTEAPKQPLLVKLPSLKNTKAMEDILGQMNTWFASYLNNEK
ncbi:class I SAM-dependent methyltransferase [Virgibacillus necropolis]|uniref:SAM-dependent methyltransferase n=1 Tax=Virgibacillus necropolis TaxID=163877 RepID=A0A221MBG2_9BACI|nr:class I SAM-dependent methyltransferase [Virgibacillus necropolis]ASN04984.1 SAM-dependent methyltransferase [Virgibacillus necropolis]